MSPSMYEYVRIHITTPNTFHQWEFAQPKIITHHAMPQLTRKIAKPNFINEKWPFDLTDWLPVTNAIHTYHARIFKLSQKNLYVFLCFAEFGYFSTRPIERKHKKKKNDLRNKLCVCSELITFNHLSSYINIYIQYYSILGAVSRCVRSVFSFSFFIRFRLIVVSNWRNFIVPHGPCLADATYLTLPTVSQSVTVCFMFTAKPQNM